MGIEDICSTFGHSAQRCPATADTLSATASGLTRNFESIHNDEIGDSTDGKPWIRVAVPEVRDFFAFLLEESE